MKYNTFFYASLFLLGLSLISCSEPTKPTSTDSAFYVKDPNYLYFKNMRAYYYEESKGPGENSNTRMNIYKLRKFSTAKDRPILFPLLIDNWIQDEAYLFLESNDYPILDPITINTVVNTDTLQFQLDQGKPQQQWEMAQQIASFLEADQPVFILDTARQSVPIFADANDRLNFLTTIKDYRRLTE